MTSGQLLAGARLALPNVHGTPRTLSMVWERRGIEAASRQWERHTIAAVENHWLKLIRNIGMHHWTIPVSVDICFQALQWPAVKCLHDLLTRISPSFEPL